jgi:type II secretory pathway predicted ATPase ExeA
MAVSEQTYSHLLPAVQALADAPDEARIRRIRTDRWLGYARAEAALTALEDLLSFPKRTRMPNLLLVGPSNNGKTMIVEKFRRSHLPGSEENARDGAIRVPVLKVQMPPAPDERRFFSAILEALGPPDRLNDRLSTKQDTAVRMMRATGVRMLVIDEVHNLLCGSRDQQRRFLNLLRWLGNELQIPLVAVGTAEGLRAIQSDDQLANRFTPFGLPPWEGGAEFSRLVNTLEASMPLKQPSNLSAPAMAQRLLSVSEGILGEVVTIVTRAAVAAVETRKEMILPEMLDEMGFMPPSERRHAVV